MSRADLLYSVLKDGRRHSRRDIQERVGYFLTNNAASELRARGLEVIHEQQGGQHFYSLNEAAAHNPRVHSPAASLSESEGGSLSPAGPGEVTDGERASLGPVPLIDGQLKMETP